MSRTTTTKRMVFFTIRDPQKRLLHPPNMDHRVLTPAPSPLRADEAGSGLGGDVGGWPVAAFFFFAGAGDGTTDSNLALLFTGSPSSPPPARCAISFLAATLLALEVRCTPSPAQMLVPSTVVRS